MTTTPAMVSLFMRRSLKHIHNLRGNTNTIDRVVNHVKKFHILYMLAKRSERGDYTVGEHPIVVEAHAESLHVPDAVPNEDDQVREEIIDRVNQDAGNLLTFICIYIYLFVPVALSIGAPQTLRDVGMVPSQN